MADQELVELLKTDVEAFNARSVVAADLRGADLTRADLTGAALIKANLRNAHLSGTNLRRADLTGADLTGADLIKANLRNAHLSGTNLRRADLRRADLSWADLTGSDLSEADLGMANLGFANLSLADLSGAELGVANLGLANLSRATLIGAKLVRTVLSEANLSEANFGRSRLGKTVFASLDLQEARGLSDAEHLAPSPVSTDTLVQSRGRLPESFLRGCGLEPWEVEYAKTYDPNLSLRAVEDILYEAFLLRAKGTSRRVFISYSHEDSRFADKLYKSLYAEGATVWLDRRDLVAGKVNDQVARQIGKSDVVLLVLSEASVKSDWVAHEISLARTFERENKIDVLCPVSLDIAWKQKVLGESRLPDPAWAHLHDKVVLDFARKFKEPFRKLCEGIWTNYGQAAVEPISLRQEE